MELQSLRYQKISKLKNRLKTWINREDSFEMWRHKRLPKMIQLGHQFPIGGTPAGTCRVIQGYAKSSQ